ncbi:MAG: WbqC family protein [Balneolaceae bacterium]|nr:WbqC family protein [Balneolaceae bacterium]
MLPTCTHLAIMLNADRVILQDKERWSRKSRVHRAKIRKPQGTQWINIPIRTKDRKKAINKVRIDHEEEWITPLLRSLEYNYRNSIYYDFYEPEIKTDLESATDYEYLLPFILYIQKRLLTFMELDLEWELSSEMEDYTSDPDELAKRLGADILYTRNMRAATTSARRNPKPKLEFSHPTYHQHFDGFEPWCCILDLLFQFGPESFRITDQLKGSSIKEG